MIKNLIPNLSCVQWLYILARLLSSILSQLVLKKWKQFVLTH